MATYLGGLSWAPEPAEGELSFDDEKIELIKVVSTVIKKYKETVLKIYVGAIEYVEITSEQVAKSKVGAVLMFGALGGLGAKSGEDRGAILVHLKSGQTAYFTIQGVSEHQMRAKLSPWLNSVDIPARASLNASHAQSISTSEPTFNQISVADEIAKLGALRAQGLLTEDEFAAQKAKLLSL
jgi:hypothetical protein